MSKCGRYHGNGYSDNVVDNVESGSIRMQFWAINEFLMKLFYRVVIYSRYVLKHLCGELVQLWANYHLILWRRQHEFPVKSQMMKSTGICCAIDWSVFLFSVMGISKYHFICMISREFLAYINRNGPEAPTFTEKCKEVMEKAVTKLGFFGILSFASVGIFWISQFSLCFIYR